MGIMKKLLCCSAILSVLLLAACGDFEWLPEQAKFALTLTPASFTEQCGLTTTDTNIESNAITVSGIASPVAISVSGGEYSVNSATFTTTAGTISTGQTVKVRPTGGKITTDNTTVTVTLTIGTTPVTFKAATGPCQQTTTP